jgi:hypothetical protein
MSLIDPQRHRERLVQSLSDDGLEELVLRLVRPGYPEAHRTRRGRDGGVDVLSDYLARPDRAWQAKNTIDGDVDWRHCRNSLKAAMSGNAPPRRYTFVFPRMLKASARDRWRDSFHPTEFAKYDELDQLDYIDDLAALLQQRPELVDLLDDGALGEYVRPIVREIAQSGVNPVATAAGLMADAAALAERSKVVGRNDPHYAYGQAGREAAQRDADIPEQRHIFTLEHGIDGLPRYSMALRDGDAIKVLTADVREGAVVKTPEPWFADTEAGRDLLIRARTGLAKGEPVRLDSSDVGIDPGTVPDRFRAMLTGDGLLRDGTLEIGLSEPLVLDASLTNDGVDRPQPFTLYRVPALPADTLAYAGALGGVVLSFDLRLGGDRKDIGPEAFDVEMTIGLTLHLQDEVAGNALRGLGYAHAFGVAEHVHMTCAGLLPPDGIEWDGGTPADDHAEEIWTVAATLATALAGLNDRDGGQRRMPSSVTDRDMACAELVLALLSDGEVHVPARGEFEVPLPREAAASSNDPPLLMTVTTMLPPLAGEPSRAEVVQEVRGANALRLVDRPNGKSALVCRSRGDASIVYRWAPLSPRSGRSSQTDA